MLPAAPPGLDDPAAPVTLESLAPTLFPWPGRAAAAAPVVIIDVLRATTTLSLAFAAGARDAYFFATPEAARAALVRLGADGGRILLCGERDGRRIDGFDRGNSPLEFDAEAVAGARLLVATTNGSRAFLATAAASKQWAVSFVNLRAAVDRIAGHLVTVCRDSESEPVGEDEPCDLRIVCAGSEGEPSIEDIACAGLFSMRLMEALGRAQLDARLVADGAALASAPETEHETMRLVASSPHGRYLQSLGGEFEADVTLCGRWDLTAAVPTGRGAHLTRES